MYNILNWLCSLGIALILSMLNSAVLIPNCPSAAAVSVRAMGEETIGNKPLNDANYKNWPNLMPVINNQSRVYHTWVNGDEQFYFRGSTEQLNQLLADFSKLKSKKKEVLILPQREQVRSFDGKQSFEFNVSMHLVGGIAKHMAGRPKGNLYWPLEPQLTIYVTPETDLSELQIPGECQLVSLAEITKRYREGLSSGDRTVRGWGIGFLARVDPYNAQSLNTIAQLSQDVDSWVALNALGQIARFGPLAKDHLSMLRQIGNNRVIANAERANQAVAEIDAACEPTALAKFNELETTFREQTRLAQEFIERWRGN